jgi:hypothetical protein
LFSLTHSLNSQQNGSAIGQNEPAMRELLRVVSSALQLEPALDPSSCHLPTVKSLFKGEVDPSVSMPFTLHAMEVMVNDEEKVEAGAADVTTVPNGKDGGGAAKGKDGGGAAKTTPSPTPITKADRRASSTTKGGLVDTLIHHAATHSHMDLQADMLEDRPLQHIPKHDVEELNSAAAADPHVLIGWQIIYKEEGKDGQDALGVVVDTRKNILGKTEFRVVLHATPPEAGKHEEALWVHLARGKHKGQPFKALRRVWAQDESEGRLEHLTHHATSHSHMVVTSDMLESKPMQHMRMIDAVDVKKRSAVDPHSLIGWQIEVLELNKTSKQEEVTLGVVVDTRKNLVGKTEFRLVTADSSATHDAAHWVRLARGEGKAGLAFTILRKASNVTVPK